MNLITADSNVNICFYNKHNNNCNRIKLTTTTITIAIKAIIIATKKKSLYLTKNVIKSFYPETATHARAFKYFQVPYNRHMEQKMANKLKRKPIASS